MAKHEQVAIVGAGPAGLVAARFLRAEGFAPVLFERAAGLGGQWDHRSASSGVWPGMRANTSRLLTRFSDLDYPEGTAAFPHEADVSRYLAAYTELFDLVPALRLGTSVERIERDPAGGYALVTTDSAGRRARPTFPRVVVATGRFNAPLVPAIDGLDSFRGSVTHAFRSKAMRGLADANVLVAGGSISALEIASELARLGTGKVVVAMRRQRYVVPKLVGGIPIDVIGLTRFGALSAESLPPAETAAALKDFLISVGGNPAAFGAPALADDVSEAGITLSQDYVPLLAEGRIAAKPWIRRVEERTVRFVDGTSAAFDAIVLGTGYALSLPFLASDIRGILDIDERHIDLADYTFHPDLDGLAFLGLYPLIGPYFPVLELQARYLAYAWSGAIPALEPDRLRAGVVSYRKGRGGRQSRLMHGMALRFARLAGVEPVPADMPDIARALLFGPLTASSFRLRGRDALPDAAGLVAREAAYFGAVREPAFTRDECDRLARLAQMRGDLGLAALAEEGLQRVRASVVDR